MSNNVLFTMLRCKQEWTCSCMSTATLIMKTEISCIATYKIEHNIEAKRLSKINYI